MQKTLLNKIIQMIKEEIIDNSYVDIEGLDVQINKEHVAINFSRKGKTMMFQDKKPKTFWVEDSTTQAKATLTDKNNIPQPAPKLKEDYDAEINKYYGSNEQDL